MTVLWTAAEAAAATGGTATGDWQVTGVTLDSRRLRPGEMFVALTDRRDGHDFVAAALAAGAGAALVARRPAGVPADAPLLTVADTLAGLVALGRAGRERMGGRVVAVTGSVGKTSAKEMLRRALSAQGAVHAAEQSFNNHWGVPLTLARMPADSAFAVVEIGMNHPGEITPLARLARPHVALITTVAPAHMAAFRSLDEIARAKAEIFAGLEPGGVAVLNRDIASFPLLERAARAAGAEVICFGADPAADFRLIEARPAPEGQVLSVRFGGDEALLRLSAPGRHVATNAMGVLAAVAALGGDVALAALALRDWQPPAGRGQRVVVPLDGALSEAALVLLDDSYNANPASMAAGLAVLAATEPGAGPGGRPGRRVAFLTDMLELGAEGPRLHAALATRPELARIDRIHCAGPLMQHLHAALPVEIRGEWHESADDLAARAHHLLDAGDVVMVKGSKGSRAVAIAQAIRALARPQGTRSG